MDGPTILTTLDRDVLRRLLKLGQGFWSNGVELEELTCRFSDESGADVPIALRRLAAAGLAESHDDRWRLTRAGIEAATHLQGDLVSDPLAGLEPVRVNPVGFPFTVLNPSNTRWGHDPTFMADVKAACRDSGLRTEIKLRMEKVLAQPTGGKPLGGVLAGVREHYLRNYRLRWTYIDSRVHFVLFAHKEDRRCSPFGA